MSLNSRVLEHFSVLNKWIFLSHRIKIENWLLLMMIIIFMVTILEYLIQSQRHLEDYKLVIV